MGKKYGLVTGTVQNVGTFSGIFKTCLDLTPKNFRPYLARGKKETSPPNRLGHRLSDTECSGLSWKWKPFSWQRHAKTVKRALGEKKGSWTDILLSMCVLKKSLGHTKHRPTRWFFSLNGSIKSPGQTQPPPGVQEPRPPRIGDPFVGLFRQSQSPMISAPAFPVISWQLRGSQCQAFKNACELLCFDNQNILSGSQWKKNPELKEAGMMMFFFQLHPL